MAMGREESDGRVVPEGRRKAVPTAAARRGGKASTASEQAGQLELFRETADSPQGTDDRAAGDRSPVTGHGAPKSRNTQGNDLPAMTMEEVANEDNLIGAFEKVASNQGAPGPDRQSIEAVCKHLDVILAKLHCKLLNGSYRPGMIRRVWIPKPGGGERGLGIPNVVDRIVQQAVHQVLGPHYEPDFHASSHGFRPGRSCHTAIAEPAAKPRSAQDLLLVGGSDRRDPGLGSTRAADFGLRSSFRDELSLEALHVLAPLRAAQAAAAKAGAVPAPDRFASHRTIRCALVTMALKSACIRTFTMPQ